MRLCDANVLINAHREQQPHHEVARLWLEETLHGGEAFGMSELVLSGFLRVTTMRSKFLTEPTPLPDALAFVEAIRSRRRHVPVRPGPPRSTLVRGTSRFLPSCSAEPAPVGSSSPTPGSLRSRSNTADTGGPSTATSPASRGWPGRCREEVREASVPPGSADERRPAVVSRRTRHVVCRGIRTPGEGVQVPAAPGLTFPAADRRP